MHMFLVGYTSILGNNFHISTICTAMQLKSSEPQLTVMISYQTSGWCLLILYVLFSSVSAGNTSCPLWFNYNNTTQQCECFPRMVSCNYQEKKVSIIDGYCLSSSGQDGLYYAGACPFAHTQNSTNRMSSELPSDPSQLNDMMCGPYNRKGLLCGQCIDGYGPTVNMECSNCSKISTVYATILYLILQFTPMTIFFICVAVFRINIMAGPLLGYVIFCQLVGMESDTYRYMISYIQSHVSTPLRLLLQSSLILCHFWCLKSYIPTFCISEHLTGIHMQIVYSLTAIYLIVLVIVTCILMELHARNYRVICFLWKPFGKILNKLNITAVTGDAVLHAFASFIFLSSNNGFYTIILLSSNNIIHRSIDWSVYRVVLYIDPTVEWLSHTHIQYLLIAAVPFLFLSLFPSLFLCIYPTRVYRYLSLFISARKRLAITAFAEALHNCFKDGLNGTRDYRAFAGMIIFIPILYSLYRYIISQFFDFPIMDSFIFMMVLLCIASYVKPCKLSLANLSLSYHITIVGIMSILFYLWDKDLNTRTEVLELSFIIILAISHILVFIWAGYAIIRRLFLHSGYHFNPSHCRVLLADLANTGKQYFHRRSPGYQVLN